MPRFGAEMGKRTGFIKVGSLATQHTTTILENEVNRIERKEYADRSALVEIAKHLHGYPLAARLAAPLLVKHSPDYLLENLVHVTDLRRDVAEAILSHTHLTPTQVEMLKILSICDGSPTIGDISSIAARSAEEVVADIDRLADDNLVEADGVALRLHPLVLDFYWKQARSSPDFAKIVSSMATHAQSLVRTIQAGSAGFIQWLAIAVRTLFLSGKAEAAIYARLPCEGRAVPIPEKGFHSLTVHDPSLMASLSRAMSSCNGSSLLYASWRNSKSFFFVPCFCSASR